MRSNFSYRANRNRTDNLSNAMNMYSIGKNRNNANLIETNPRKISTLKSVFG